MPVMRNDVDEVYRNGVLVSSTSVVRDMTDDASRTTIRQQASDALVANRAYLALVAPLATDNLAQIKALTRQNSGLIRMMLNRLDGTD